MGKNKVFRGRCYFMKTNAIKTRTGVSQQGFTLIELMSVVTIIAVLMLVAYPSYSEYIKRGNRAEAQAYLMRAAQLQQQFFNDARRFAATAEDLNLNVPDRVGGNYDVAFAINDPNDVRVEFTITATPKSGTRQADDGVLVVDHTGTKTRDGEPW